MFSENDIEFMLVLFSEGLTFIMNQRNLDSDLGFLPADTPSEFNEEQIRKFVYAFPKAYRIKNPDLFFSVLLGGMTHNFDSSSLITDSIVNDLSVKGYPESFFSKISEHFPTNSALKTKLVKKCNRYISLDDASLVAAAKESFDINYLDWLDIPVNQNLIITKINHGYWEQTLCAYAKSFKRRASAGVFRSITPFNYARRHEASRLNAALAQIIKKSLRKNRANVNQRVKTRLSINFSAGEDSCANLLIKPLSPLTRGAIVGTLGFFSSLNLPKPIQLGDGCESKSLIAKNLLNEFVKRQMNAASAVLLVVPPHLKNIEITGVTSNVYRLIIPAEFANETWRVSLPIFLAMVKRIAQKHGQVTILTQAAMLAPLLGLVLAEIANTSEYLDVRFFDLGRALDVATPEIVAQQGWFKINAGESDAYPFKLSDKPTTNLLTPDEICLL